MRLHPKDLNVGSLVWECAYGKCTQIEITSPLRTTNLQRKSIFINNIYENRKHV